MKKGEVFLLAFCLGLLVMLVCTQVFKTDTSSDELPDPQIIYSTKYVDRAVEKEVSKECFYWIKQVNDLRHAQDRLSKSKGEMKNVLSDLQVNLYNKDPNVLVRLQRDMTDLQVEMDSAWLKIGKANAYLSAFQEGEEPCR